MTTTREGNKQARIEQLITKRKGVEKTERKGDVWLSAADPRETRPGAHFCSSPSCSR